ncbi:MAG: response regulator, partial [Planctomycetes bacterium]|nr:response regulator [Planctomycetota bacterium]
KGKHILVTDDEAHIRELLFDLFEDQGCDITTASNGKQAINKMNSKHFDAVILDWQMPILDGSGFLDQLLELPANKRAPVIVVSGWQSGNLLSEAQKTVAPVTISKPFKSDDMIEAVKEVLKVSVQRKAII